MPVLKKRLNIFIPANRNHQNRDVSRLPEDFHRQQLGSTDNGICEDNGLLA